MTKEKALAAIENYLRGSLSVKAEDEAKAWMALTELKDMALMEWHETFEDVPGSFPDDERTVLVSCKNCSEPMPGQWRIDEDGGGNWYVGDLDETFLQDGLVVDGWWELPKKPEVE